MQYACQQLTAETLSKALSYFEQGMNTLLQDDPEEGHRAKESQRINSAIISYKTLQKEQTADNVGQTS